MLIEADKRGLDNALPLLYSKKDEPRFYVPQNLYLIGLIMWPIVRLLWLTILCAAVLRS